MDLVNDDTLEHSGEQRTYTSGWIPGQPDNGGGGGGGGGGAQLCMFNAAFGWLG